MRDGSESVSIDIDLPSRLSSAVSSHSGRQRGSALRRLGRTERVSLPSSQPWFISQPKTVADSPARLCSKSSSDSRSYLARPLTKRCSTNSRLSEGSSCQRRFKRWSNSRRYSSFQNALSESDRSPSPTSFPENSTSKVQAYRWSLLKEKGSSFGQRAMSALTNSGCALTIRSNKLRKQKR